MAGSLNKDPLFIGLTRPTLIFGVSVQYAMLNMMLCTIYFINFSDFKVIFVSALVHGVGYLLCIKEPRFMELYINKFGKCNHCPNKNYYGANSYDI